MLFFIAKSWSGLMDPSTALLKQADPFPAHENGSWIRVLGSTFSYKAFQEIPAERISG